ncbi:MAG: hypothetical protein IKE05_04210, partial [Clostridia bacterium]|nr:hypothetical protein [Clostridia bacterium]
SPVAPSQGLSPATKEGLAWGLGIGIPAAAWLGSGIGCIIASKVYARYGNKEKADNCKQAGIGILAVPPAILLGAAFIAGGGR